MKSIILKIFYEITGKDSVNRKVAGAFSRFWPDKVLTQLFRMILNNINYLENYKNFCFFVEEYYEGGITYKNFLIIPICK